jgi:ribosome assembly protein YihI (activator of Der GTPase)
MMMVRIMMIPDNDDEKRWTTNEWERERRESKAQKQRATRERGSSCSFGSRRGLDR